VRTGRRAIKGADLGLHTPTYRMATMDAQWFSHHVDRWRLAPDGPAIVTPRARLLPVRRDGMPMMLKVATDPEERFGGILLDWWNGDGAARVFEIEGDALLMERATGKRSLTAYAQGARDDEATHVLCDVIAVLHAARDKPLPEGLVTLPVWFEALEPTARSHGGWLPRAAAEARALLAESAETIPLHGDIHHDNVLDFGERGWLAIDPKHIRGDRAFDYANLFCNPDMDFPERPVAVLRERFLSRLEIVVARSGLERRRLLRWIVAWTGLSAAWLIQDGAPAEVDARVGAMALAELDG
jgi:streptomycin 6-kinase